MIGDIPGGPGRPVSAPDELAYKRIVLQDRNGLRIVLGRAAAQPDDLLVVQRAGHDVGFSLVRVTARFYLYKEVTPPPASGRLGDFHPSQR